MSDKDSPFGPPPSDNPFGSKPSDNPFGAPPSSDPFGSAAPAPAPPAGEQPDAWRAPPPARDPFDTPPPGAGAPRAEGAIAALVLGIVGMVFCPLCAPFAWVMGRKAEQQVDASGGTLSGRGEATAGKVLGIVSCCLSVLLIVLFVMLLAIGASVSTS
ncbi:MAG: hypothetical protein QOJ89_220 [bacterium]|jgi:hypothetical protein